MDHNLVIHQFDFNYRYACGLVDDVSEIQMTIVPSNGLDNHPAFTLGHLVSGCAGLAEDLGAPFEMPEGWAGLFLRTGPGDRRMPDADRSKYPDKAHLLEELNRQHEKVKSLINTTGASELRKEIKWRFSKYMPTTMDLVVFMCINHEAMHLGQLAAWRRARGLESALARL